MVDWQAYATGEHRIPCPSCKRGERDKSAGLTIDADGSGVLHCFRCAHVETYRPERGATLRAPAIQPAHKPQKQKHTSLSDWGRTFWMQCQPLSGVALDYLKSRRCLVPPADGDLRWHSAAKHPSGHTGPALVGLITDAITGAPLSLHRTWITPYGKAKVEPPRMPLAGHSIKGGCIRLWPDDCVTGGLAIGEGIETCLSIAHAFEPVWSVIDAGHLADFPVLAGVEVLTICQDNDTAGIKATEQCAARWVDAGRTVRATCQAANDINDILTEAA